MGENCTQKTGQNALKLHLFWAINSKNISKLGWGREDDRNAQYIPLKKRHKNSILNYYAPHWVTTLQVMGLTLYLVGHT